MASTVSASSSLLSIRRSESWIVPSSSTSSLSYPILRLARFRSHDIAHGYPNLSVVKKVPTLRRNIIKCVAEETLIPEEAEDNDTKNEGEEASTTDQTVSVPVSPSDVLTMFFQAEGTMNETAIPTVTKALEEAEGITNLKVRVVEGIASVELTKQTTVQAAGVASGLVEIIQGSGFKLQALNLSFEDEEDLN